MAMLFPEELILGIPELDEQHRNLFGIYNEFSAAVENGRGKDSLSLLFESLEELTTYHFRYEERLIDKSGYPDAEAHIQEHVQIHDEIKQLKTVLELDDVTNELILSIKRFLIRYLINHTKNSDFQLVRYLVGLHGEIGFALAGGGDYTKLRRFGETLVDLKIISRITLEKALERQKESGRKIGEVLLEMGAVKSEDIVEAYAIQIGLLNPPLEWGAH